MEILSNQSRRATPETHMSTLPLDPKKSETEFQSLYYRPQTSIEGIENQCISCTTDPLCENKIDHVMTRSGTLSLHCLDFTHRRPKGTMLCIYYHISLSLPFTAPQFLFPCCLLIGNSAEERVTFRQNVRIWDHL